MDTSTQPVTDTQTATLPDHTQLPEEDGSIAHNFQEHPQSNLLTSSQLPRLQELHPDGQFCIGQDSGIYYHATQPPLDGCKAPDWFYVPNVPPMLDGEMRRSYVLWQELVRPCLARMAHRIGIWVGNVFRGAGLQPAGWVRQVTNLPHERQASHSLCAIQATGLLGQAGYKPAPRKTGLTQPVRNPG